MSTRQAAISGIDAELIAESSPGAGEQYLITRVYLVENTGNVDTFSINYKNVGWGSYIIYAKNN